MDKIKQGFSDNLLEHIPYIDDTLMAGRMSAITQAIVPSIEACFTIFSSRDDAARPCPISLEKFTASPCFFRREQLGLIIDTHLLTIEIPLKKLVKINELMRHYHHNRKQAKLLECCQLLGLLDFAGLHFHHYHKIRPYPCDL